MRLLQRDDSGNYSLTADLSSDDVPPYAILSHTWGEDEVIFTDMAKLDDWHQKAGYHKIKFCADQAKQQGIKFFWVDTCCIDKSDGIELQRAINSMFRWYRNAKRCFVYLADVSVPTSSIPQDGSMSWEDAFRKSRWFTRGWTLQELIAPKAVDFYSKEGTWLGDKQSLEPILRHITGIPARALRGTPLSDFTVSERETWIHGRQTKYEEDMAYSLLGIFDVHMPLIYGEGQEKAQRRLREEVNKTIKGTRINDFSVTFSLSEVPETQYFVARESEIAQVRIGLSSDGSRRVIILHGLGGIGKTQLTVAYLKRYRDEYSAIFWLNIKDEASIQHSFRKVAKQILEQHPNASPLNSLDSNASHDTVIEAVKTWLNLPGNARWLAVYDNYDNPKLAGKDGGIDINRFVPTAYHGSIIITTRLSQINLTGNYIRVKRLNSIEDSLKILSLTSGRDILHDDVDAQKLISKLDGLPLALNTAGTYLRNTSMSFANYTRLYDISWVKLHESTPNLGSYEDRTLCLTWQVSYLQVQDQNPIAARLLQWWAYFDNEDIWLELIQSNREDSQDRPVWLHELADELNFHSAMQTLQAFGFVEPCRISPDQMESGGYSIHTCLHSWTIHILNKNWDDSLAELALACIASTVPFDREPQFWLLQRRLLSHGIRASATVKSSRTDLSWALRRIGRLYADNDRLQDAENMYLRALQDSEKVERLRIYHELALLHARQERLQEAEELYLKILEQKEIQFSLSPHLVVRTTHNLGSLYMEQGKLQAAEEMYLRAQQDGIKAWGPDHVTDIGTLNNRGILYRLQGKLQEAEEMLLQALKENEKKLGSDHLIILDIIDNLGLVYMDQDKLEAAEEICLRALKEKEKTRGPDHISTLDTAGNLGLIYKRHGRLKQAEELYLRVLRGKEKVYGSDNTSILYTVCNLGVLYRDQDKLQEAEKMYLRALQGRERIWGPDHKSTLETVTDLGFLYKRQGRFKKAEEMYLRVLRGLEKAIGPEAITTYRPAIKVTIGLMVVMQEQGNLAEASMYDLPIRNSLEELYGLLDTGTNSLKDHLASLNRESKEASKYKPGH